MTNAIVEKALRRHFGWKPRYVPEEEVRESLGSEKEGTDEQTAELVDRTTERLDVFDMETGLQAGFDSDVDRIVDEVLSEIDVSELSGVEIEKLREYILGLIGVGRTDGRGMLECTEIDAIELDVRSFLKKAFGAARRFVNRAVKKVTGKDLGEWRKTIFGTRGSKYTTEVGKVTVISVNGVPWNPDDHPRGPDGRFVEKGTGTTEPKTDEKKTKAAAASEVERGSEFAGFQPGRDLPEARMDLILEQEGIDVSFFGTVDDDTRLTVKGLIVDGILDGTFSDIAKRVIIYNQVDALGSDIKEKYGTETANYMRAFWGGVYYTPGLDMITVGGTVDQWGRSYMEIALLHEIYHSMKTKERKEAQKRTSGHDLTGQIEEVTTDLLARKFAEERYGYGMKEASSPMASTMAKFLYIKNDGDIDATWNDIERYHNEGFALTSKMREEIKQAFPDLTPQQLNTVVATGRAFGGFDQESLSRSMFLKAIDFHITNLRKEGKDTKKLQRIRDAKFEDAIKFLWPNPGELFMPPGRWPRHYPNAADRNK